MKVGKYCLKFAKQLFIDVSKIEGIFGNKKRECSINKVTMNGEEFYIFLVKKDKEIKLNIPLPGKLNWLSSTLA